MHSNQQYRKKRKYNDAEENAKHFGYEYPNKKKDYKGKSETEPRDSSVQNSITYYENILKDLRKGIDDTMKEECINNALQESQGKEIELSCHSIASHCLELLIPYCEDTSIIQRFMRAFSEDKTAACTSSNASHITELLIHHAIKALQNDSVAEDVEEKFGTYCVLWVTELGNFALEFLHDFLSSQSSCHVLCTLVRALAGDLSEKKDFMSKKLKNHKQEFQSHFDGFNSQKIQKKEPVILEQISPCFSDLLKKLYKAIIKSENLTDYASDSSSATVIEALCFALKKRLPKCCNKMIKKVSKKLFLEKNKDNIPLALLHQTTSYVFEEMFKVADEDLQLKLWSLYISDHIGKLVMHGVGNFVIQRLYDAIKSRTFLDTACQSTWGSFEDIVKAKHYGIFVSIATACNRLGVQQSFFMENIMKCLHCFEPIERQELIIPLLLNFDKFEDFTGSKNSERMDLKICLQGSLVAQAILKFQKPIKAIKSLLSMSPQDLEYLAAHHQGCHVLNAFFGSVTVGEKNKEALISHLGSVLISIACDRNGSLTLSRIWTCLSLKLKEMVARYLSRHQSTLKSCNCGYAIYKKFGIVYLRKIQEWRQIQSNITSVKKQKH